MTATVALYVSGHGFGHAVRSAEVAAALLRAGARVVVRTDAPAWLFPAEVEYLTGEPVDVGVVQHDGLEFDIDDTRQRWAEFGARLPDRADAEAALLSRERVDVVVGDVPPLAFAAAGKAGLPSAALTNFGWDWIYAAWPGFENVVAQIREAYAQADVLYRLPLHGASPDAFPAFRAVIDVPLIARTARRSRADVRAELGIAPDARAVLISFGAFQAERLAVANLARLDNYLFVVTPPIAALLDSVPSNVLRLAQPADYVSLLAACDAVVTKPGYGIVADCLANRVPVLYTDRGPFREYDVLACALETLGRARYVPRADVLAGRLGEHLAALAASRTRWTDQPMNGARVVAERLLGLPHSSPNRGNVIENLA